MVLVYSISDTINIYVITMLFRKKLTLQNKMMRLKTKVRLLMMISRKSALMRLPVAQMEGDGHTQS